MHEKRVDILIWYGRQHRVKYMIDLFLSFLHARR